MRESFMTPRPKKLLPAELVWLLSLFAFLVIVMVGSALFLEHAIENKAQGLEVTTKDIEALRLRESKVSLEIRRLQVLAKMRESISTKNRLNKENVKNFFDLVPDGIVLELAELREGTLRLKGTTRSKRYFNETFQRSLDSLFSRSSTKFYAKKGGGYRFNNISIMGTKK